MKIGDCWFDLMEYLHPENRPYSLGIISGVTGVSSTLLYIFYMNASEDKAKN